MESLLFTIDSRRYAVPLAAVAEVVPAVNIRPLPHAPDVIEGAVNVRGEVLPVLALRKRLGHAERAVRASEYFVLVNARSHRVILRSDTTPEIASLPDPVEPQQETVSRALARVLPMHDGLALFSDIDAFIDADDIDGLVAALASVERGG